MESLQRFVGRKSELARLEALWAEPAARLLVLYGRRRVGKSRLLTHWIRQSGRRVLYWQAELDTKEAQLRQFSQQLFNFANPSFPAPPDFSYASWEQAFSQAAQLAQSERLGLFIDEFSYLMAADESLPSKIQKLWDHSLQDSNLLLCLSGSHLGMMERGILAASAPLYGRASALLHLQPLSFGVSGQYFPSYTPEERMLLYAVFGGIPFYWQQINPDVSLEENLRQKIFSPASFMDAEMRYLLADYVREPRNYLGILRAIAAGSNVLSEIKRSTGIDATSLPKYLETLGSAGFIARFEPLIPLAHATRSGRYYLTDPFLRFYFRFIAARRTQLALDEPGQAYTEFERHVQDFIGTYTWEEVCREWVLRAANRSALPLYPDQVESAWSKDTNIDIVGLNTMKRHLVLGECKWLKTPVDVKDLRSLVEKTPLAIPNGRTWKLLYLLFSKSGFTPGAQAYTTGVAQAPPPAGGGYTVAGFQLLDLAQVDRDLAQWAG